MVYTLRGGDPLGRALAYSVSGDALSVDAGTGEVTLVTEVDREATATLVTIATVMGGFGNHSNRHGWVTIATVMGG